MYRINNNKSKARNNQSQRFAQIAKLGEIIFHSQDLANLWQIKDPNTLYTTLKRYTQKGWLYRIYKGLYSLKPLEELDPAKLGLKALRGFGYVSTETVLARAGVIQQVLPVITLVSTYSRRFTIGSFEYRSRKLQDKYLFNPLGVSDQAGVKTASPERAVADLLYFNSRVYLDGAQLIKWRQVKKLQKKLGYPLTPKRYDFT